MFETKTLFGVATPEVFKECTYLMLGLEFPWHYLPDTTYENYNKKANTTPAFAHLLLGNNGHRSAYLDKFTPIYESIISQLDIQPKKVFRMRLGFLMNTRYLTPQSPYVYNEPHRDAAIPHITACYHFWHSDGKTHIFNETEELPDNKGYSVHKSFEAEQNSCIVFDGTRYHASTCPKIHSKRIVLTINFTM